MKIPAVALAAAFGSGIVLGLQPQLASHINTALMVIPAILGIAAVVCVALALTLRDRLVAAGILSLGCWIALGVVAACVAERPLAADHVLRRIAAGTVELKTPLRWHGRLRSEPARLPWGYGIDVDLSGVDAAGELIPVSGGLRLGFTPKEGDASLPEVHAGDEVAVIAQGRLPQVYRDEGAFDRRGFLARQNIHLLATLRASSLLQKTGTGAPTIASWLARVRERIRERVDEMFAGSPQSAAVLRAMLLGDRSFIERSESVDYQKTGVFHVLVVAGLHVGALAFFLFWVGRKLRLPQGAAITPRTQKITSVLNAY
jgi:competence protein ComEC